MCDFSKASVGQLTSSFGAGFGAVGAYSQAKTQQAALQAQAQVAENNAQLAQWQGLDAQHRGEAAASRVQLRGAQVKGDQRAELAANGVDLSFGSAQAVLNDTDYFTALDVNTVVDNASREAWGYRQTARDYLDRARMTRAGADSISPWLAAGTSLLTSATQVAGRWYGANSAGAVATRDGFSEWAYRGNRGMGD
ncbi:virion core protein, T7 gp14 family [Variovorax sp.]|uniref:virion core protein, T7 gp14 family n=1 Tax=Variovorax sp. TaxID=1871043 RepID=UPI003BABD12D